MSRLLLLGIMSDYDVLRTWLCFKLKVFDFILVYQFSFVFFFHEESAMRGECGIFSYAHLFYLLLF